jgi:sodium-dependent phosphate transporter
LAAWWSIKRSKTLPNVAPSPAEENEKQLAATEASQATYKEPIVQDEDKHNAKLLQKRGPLG